MKGIIGFKTQKYFKIEGIDILDIPRYRKIFNKEIATKFKQIIENLSNEKKIKNKGILIFFILMSKFYSSWAENPDLPGPSDGFKYNMEIKAIDKKLTEELKNLKDGTISHDNDIINYAGIVYDGNLIKCLDFINNIDGFNYYDMSKIEIIHDYYKFSMKYFKYKTKYYKLKHKI